MVKRRSEDGLCAQPWTARAMPKQWPAESCIAQSMICTTASAFTSGIGVRTMHFSGQHRLIRWKSSSAPKVSTASSKEKPP